VITVKKNKVFIFIVDALRLDFVVKKSNTNDNTINYLDSPFNQFKNIHYLLMQNNASQSILFGFKADPPKEISQRLKGLTTGTLPTFIDFGSNFNSSRITEDNFLDQFKTKIKTNSKQNENKSEVNSNKFIVLGNDTWK
jgi:phosphatidylinositol glycan class O